MKNKKDANIQKIIEYCIYALVFSLPLVIFPPLHYEIPKIFTIQIFTIIIFLVFLSLFPNYNLSKHNIYIPLIGYFIVIVLTTFNSVSPFLSLWGDYNFNQGFIFHLTFLIIFFILLNSTNTYRQLNTLIIIIVATGCIVGMYGVLQHFGWDFIFPEHLGKERVFATLGNPVHLGGYAAVIIPLCLFFIIVEDNIFLKYLGYTSFIFLYISLLLSYSRGAYIAFGISFMFILLVLLKGKNFKKNIKQIITILAIILITGTAISTKKISVPYSEEKIALKDRAISSFDTKERASAARLVIWDTALNIIRDYPILGCGLNAFGVAFLKYQPQEYAKLEGKSPITTSKAHNQILHTTSTCGFLGLFSFLWIVIVSVKKYFYVIYTTLNYKIKYLLFFSLSCLVGYFIKNQFNFDEPSVFLIFWILIGIPYLVDRIEKNKISTKKHPKSKSKTKVKTNNIFLIKILLIIPAYIIAIFLIIKIYNVMLSDVYFNKGVDNLNLKNTEEALVYFQKATILNPNVPEYLYWRGRCYTELNKHDDGIISLKKILKFYPNYPLGIWNIGYIYAKKGDYKKAIYYYEKALNDLKRISPHLLYVYFFFLGDAYSKEGNFTKAVKMYKESVKENPDFPDAYLVLGDLYFEKNDLDNAILYWIKFSKIKPNDAGIRLKLAKAWYLKGKIQECVIELKKCISIDPDGEFGKEAKQRLLLFEKK